LRIDFLFWEGCPSHPEARARLDAALARAGIEAEIAVREIETDDEAAQIGFPGSPTILIEGRDVQVPDSEAPTGLTCRLYRTSDGRPAPYPDALTLDRALQEAIRR
jgi:hypothetical protein